MNEIKINEEGQYLVNDIVINEKIFNEELFEYRIVDREDLIDNLIDWISEAPRDKEIMKEDLRYLMDLKDDFIFSSISTNEYIARSDNEDEFDDLCSELLELNKEVNKK